MLDILGKLAQGGWDELDNVGQHFAKMTREQGEAERQETDRQARIVATALGTDEGKALLDLLLNMTLLRQPDEAERAAMTAESYAILKARREGQNSLVFMLLARLQQHHGQEQQPAGGVEP